MSDPGNTVSSPGLCKVFELSGVSEEGTGGELAVWSCMGTQRDFHLLDVFLKKVPQDLHQVGESWSLLGITMPAAQHDTVTAEKKHWSYTTEIPSYPAPQLLPMWCLLAQCVLAV